MAIVCEPFVPVLHRMRVLSFLDIHYVLSNKQIAAVVYGNSEYGHWKARHETKKLFDAGLVKRSKIMGSNDMVYYSGKKPDDLEHLVLVNWVWVKLHTMGKLESFENEKQLEGLVPDAYFVYDGKPYFLELHRSVNNRFDKVELYTHYFEGVAWATPEWPGGQRFAVILVITDTEGARDFCQKHIDKRNSVGLRFRVATLKEFWENPEVYLKW